MLHFLRQIRQKLIIQENTKKYLLYAVGEILLVVIGILIALQINNWNEQRVTSNQQKYLLIELEKEFRQNLKNVDTDIATNTGGLSVTINIIERIQSNVLTSNKQELDSLIANTNLISGFDPVSGVIDDIINTGKLEVVTDDSLRYLLANWGEQVSDLYDDINIRNVHYFEFILPFISKNYTLKNTLPYFEAFTHLSDQDWEEWKNIKASATPLNEEALNSTEFESLLFYHGINQEYVIANSKSYRKYIIDVLELIEKEKSN